MPPKAQKSVTKASTSRDIVSTGPKEVVSSKKSGTGNVRPTTSRALVLRNGKHGARGTGEMTLSTKMTGSEKLDLLAEDLVEKSQSAIRAPFKIEDCVEIAISQFKEFIDDVRNLKDHDLFHSVIDEELKARAPQTKNAPDAGRNPTYLASVIANKIHNAYMVASAWKLVADNLCELEEDGLQSNKVVQQLTANADLRARYLVLYDMVNILVDINQTKFAVLATTTPHYASYFKEFTNSDGSKTTSFDWPKAREACRSFIDCIIIELCFPRDSYPKAILYSILRDAVDEAPREARRFPQALWDAVGDLAVCVQLQSLIETPLLHPDAQAWKDEPRKMPPEYDLWIDAQLYSEAAAEKSESFKDAIYPLERTKKAEVLANMWKLINTTYVNQSGKDVDSLWALTLAIKPTPRWHPHKAVAGDETESEDEDAGPYPKRKKMLAITNEPESDDSMPPLQDVSDTEDEDDDWDDSDDSDSEEEEDAESGYDTDEEDELRELYKEAMDTVHGVDWNNPEDKLEDDPRKGNPFLKMLGSLRGRMFQSSTKLKTAAGTASALPTKKQKKKAAQAAKAAQVKAEGESSPPPASPTSLKTTVEEVKDEDEGGPSRKKKKKKKSKKKKTAGAADEDDDADDEPEPEPAPAPVKAPVSPKSAKTAKPPVPAGNQSTASFIPPPVEQATAQSARSYLKSEKLDEQKSKVKSRPDHATAFVKQKGVLGRLEAEEETKHDKKEKRTFFASLRKKTRGYLHQLLHTAEDDTKGSAGMKWETFVKVMEQVGFEVNPSTAGSSVRFTPKNGKDNPISFHKPHPDSTIPPKMLKQFSKRLRDHYGWVPEDLE